MHKNIGISYRIILYEWVVSEQVKIRRELTTVTLTSNIVRCGFLLGLQIVIFACNEHVVKLCCIIFGITCRCSTSYRCTGHLCVFWRCTRIWCVARTTLSTAAPTRSRSWLQVFVFLLNFQWVARLQFIVFTINVLLLLSKYHRNNKYQIYNILQLKIIVHNTIWLKNKLKSSFCNTMLKSLNLSCFTQLIHLLIIKLSNMLRKFNTN